MLTLHYVALLLTVLVSRTLRTLVADPGRAAVAGVADWVQLSARLPPAVRCHTRWVGPRCAGHAWDAAGAWRAASAVRVCTGVSTTLGDCTD